MSASTDLRPEDQRTSALTLGGRRQIGAVVTTLRVDRAPAPGLIGRERELAALASFLDSVRDGGATLLLPGATGIGKTGLLDATERIARSRGMRVLSAAGFEPEGDLAYSGAHQALGPLVTELGDRLAPAHRAALTTALGLDTGPVPSTLLVCTAALTLLREAAASSPVLLVVDDLPWLDRPSAFLLAFLARRLGGTGVGLIAGYRSDGPHGAVPQGLPELEVGPLDDDAAGRLLADRFPGLSPLVRDRVLIDAQGNPLALIELPPALSESQRTAGQDLPDVLPLRGRLHRAFTARVRDLPRPTRLLLLLAVLDGTGSMPRLETVAPRLDDLAPAEEAGLVSVTDGGRRLVFAHPLVRSAVAELSTSDERRAAHRALADGPADRPERIRHLTEAAVGPDESTAELLHQTAHRSLDEGDPAVAVNALVRAAELSPHRADRARRLAEAAYLASGTIGDLQRGHRLLAEARRAQPGRRASLAMAVAAAQLVLHGEGDLDGAHRQLVAAIEAEGAYDAADRTVAEAFHTLNLVCTFAGEGSTLWTEYHDLARRLGPRPPLLLRLTGGVPELARRPDELDALDSAVDDLAAESDPVVILRTARAAHAVDRLAGCRDALWRVVRDGRSGGAVASAIGALSLLALDDFQTGQWRTSLELADEGLALCETHDYRLLAAPLRAAAALGAAGRGDHARARDLAQQLDAWALPRGMTTMRWYSSRVRALSAIGRGDFEEAYHHATAISPAGTLPAHGPVLGIALDLVEAAVRTGRRTEAEAHVAALHAADVASLSPRLALITSGAAALVAPSDLAGELLAGAISAPGVERWPFDLARVQLAYGEHLRRVRATTESRRMLATALETFERLGAQPWADRASQELRAAGQSSRRPGADGPAQLSPQEHEIAQLAATGLTNREIGNRLYLSPRTVGAHLYRIFPKLGITSRAALRDALVDVG